MRLAVTVCASKENCINGDKHLCRTPKTTPTPATTTTTTTTTPTTTTTTTQSTTTKNEVTPNAASKQILKNESCSKEGFGVTAVACLIGGLFAGLVLGFSVVLVTQKYAKRYKKKKKVKAAKLAIINKDPAIFEDNKAYRYSMEGKRLLSTSSNGSSERYSVVPPVPVQRVSPPPGTVAV